MGWRSEKKRVIFVLCGLRIPFSLGGREGRGAGERSGISSHSNTHSLSVALPPYVLLYVHTFKCILPFLDQIFFPSLEENNNNCCPIRRQRKLDGKKRENGYGRSRSKVVIDFLLGCMKNNDVKPGGKRGGREGGEASYQTHQHTKSLSLSLFESGTNDPFNSERRRRRRLVPLCFATKTKQHANHRPRQLLPK